MLKLIEQTVNDITQLADMFSMADLVASILAVSSLTSKKSRSSKSAEREVCSPMKQEPSALVEAIRKVSVAAARAGERVEPPSVAPVRLLSALRLERNEEVHSHAIATCFSASSPAVSTFFLGTILRKIGAETQLESADLIVERERSIGSLPGSSVLPPEILKRRIDLIVHHPQVVLAIENKVDSNESRNQTSDYFRAMANSFNHRKVVYGILLSPDGRQPECASFHALSYADLYECLRTTVDQVAGEKAFLEVYSSEVFEIFVRSRVEAHKKTIQYWKRKAA